jgi:hypothetical protein
LIAINWGWSDEETAAHLFQESNKARKNSEAYALRAARNAHLEGAVRLCGHAALAE